LFAANVARNPFQRWIVQRSLKAYLNNHSTPLHLIYSLLTTPELTIYNSVPVSKEDWEEMPTTGQLLLGEISGLAVNSRTGWANQLSEYLVFNLTWFLRDRHQPTLIAFSKMLYRLANLNLYPNSLVGHSLLKLLKNIKAYTELTLYPGGEEITRSFTAFTAFFNYDNILSLPLAMKEVLRLDPNETSIRPAVLTALVHLATVGAEVNSYQTETSDFNKKSILTRIRQSLNRIDKFVIAEVTTPEKIILQKIIKKWSILIEKSRKYIEENDHRSLASTFPSYRGSIPRYLNPLYLRHYFLLAYWVYFRPTAGSSEFMVI
jgi:hypothetical protein